MEFNYQFNNIQQNPGFFINARALSNSQPNIRPLEDQYKYYDRLLYNDQFTTYKTKLPYLKSADKKSNNIIQKNQIFSNISKHIVFDNTSTPYSNRIGAPHKNDHQFLQDKYEKEWKNFQQNNPITKQRFNEAERVDHLINMRSKTDKANLKKYSYNGIINVMKNEQFKDLSLHRDQVQKQLNNYKVSDKMLQNIRNKYQDVPDKKTNWFDDQREEIYLKKIKNENKKISKVKYQFI